MSNELYPITQLPIYPLTQLGQWVNGSFDTRRLTFDIQNCRIQGNPFAIQPLPVLGLRQVSTSQLKRISRVEESV
jgi:hypothetical protein